MDGSTPLLPSSLKSLPGKRVRSVARILFEHGGRFDADDGPLELFLDDGTVVLLDGAGDGESLRLRNAHWVEPFEPPLSEENRLFIERHGKWCRVDQSSEPTFSRLVGKVISSVMILVNEFDKVAGVQLSIEGTNLWFVVAADECHVHWLPPLGYTLSDTFAQ
jgi:hypothetical protein